MKAVHFAKSENENPPSSPELVQLMRIGKSNRLKWVHLKSAVGRERPKVM